MHPPRPSVSPLAISTPAPRLSVPLLVLALLAAAAAWSWATQAGGRRAEAPELVLTRGSVLALADDRGGPVFEAIAVSGGTIVALGDAGEVEALAGPDTRVVDLGGAVVMPALVDHHVHLLNTGLSVVNRERDENLYLDLLGIDSLDGIAARVRAEAASRPPGTWILGKGWSQGAWGSTSLPRHDVLTAAAPEHPVYLTRVDGHAGWVNAAALRVAGIDASTPDPPGGAILRDADGRPTGVLLERANELVTPLLPEPDDETLAAAFRAAAQGLAARGVTRAYDAGFLQPPGVVALNADLGRYLGALREAAGGDAALPLRVHLMVPAPSALADAVRRDPAAYRDLAPGVEVTHVKLFADGAMGSRGGFLSEPFADEPSTRGVQRMTRRELHEETTRTLDAGLDVATHAIGDAAIHTVLDVYGQILSGRPGLDPRRLRIEHYSVAQPGDVQRAAELGVVLSIQPNFVAPADDGATMEDARVGPDAPLRVYAWGRLAAAGARLAGGTDFFTVPPGASLSDVHAAATRRNAAGLPPDGWHPEDRLDRLRALRLMTTWYPPGGEPPRAGRLEVGAPAHLVALSGDPLAAADAELLDIAVLATWLDGRATYSDGSLDLD